MVHAAEWTVIAVIVVMIVAWILVVIHMLQHNSFIFKKYQRPPLDGAVPLNAGSRKLSTKELQIVKSASKSIGGQQ